MTYDADTVCETLKSPLAWAQTGSMPGVRHHFEDVVASLRQTHIPATTCQTPDLRGLDMARAASELGL